MKTLYLPNSLRPELQKTWGTFILGTRKEVIKKFEKFCKQRKFKKIIMVGDYCSLVFPSDIGIFDGKMRREKTKENLPFSLRCSNPAGTIQEEVWPVIKKAINENKNVFVDGEEDLLVIPAVLLSENNTIVVYGLFEKGICVVEVSEETKNNFKKLLSKFNLEPEKKN